MIRIYEGDRAAFLAAFTKENILQALDRQGEFTAAYRLVDTGTPLHVNMKITRLPGDTDKIILGVNPVNPACCN